MALTKARDLEINRDLYNAMMNKDDPKVIDICRRIPKGPLHTLTIHEDTVIHMAIFQKKTNLALKLLEMVSSSDNHKLTWQNSGGNTILHETATNSKTVRVAEAILARVPMLLSTINKEGETPLFYAARHGKTNIYHFLHDEVSRAIEDQDLKTFLRRDDKFTILHIAILSRNYKVAHHVATNHKDLIAEKDADDMTPLQLFSTIKPKFHPEGLFERMMFKLVDSDVTLGSKFSFVNEYKRQKHSCEWAHKLAAVLIKKDKSWETTESWTDNRGLIKFHDNGRTTSTQARPEVQKITTVVEANFHKPPTPLMLATKHNSTEIVRRILEMYPQAVEHVDKDGHNILHLAILHRRLEIIAVVEDMKYPLDRLRGRLDRHYNTLLHMVGKKEDELKEDVRHPAQELKDDLRLYKRVEKLSTTLDSTTRNADQKTPPEVFKETNDKLRQEAKNWMSENAKNCSIVAVLIATVAFTSAYTLPGGPDSEGHPILEDRPMFVLFTIADAISLSTALTSVIVFLNIVTSPFHFKDFASYLFEKQLTALILLIISVAMMMVAFAATLILTISNQGKWSDMTLYGVSFFPVLVFLYAYIPDYMNIIRDFYRQLKKMIGKLVLGVGKIWELKPKSTHPSVAPTHLGSRSPV